MNGKSKQVPLALLAAVLAAVIISAPPAAAQDETLTLSMTRTFGYGFGGDIQGIFALVAKGPPDLTLVRFHVDDEILAEDGEAPFRAQLHTGDYPMGDHALWAEGLRGNGDNLISNTIAANFVSASAGWDTAGRMLTPVLAVVGLAMAISLGTVAFSGRRYKPGVYGSAGGAICPRCALPMTRHWSSPNLGKGKLERCPHCGKWSIVGRASAEALAAAEARLTSEGGIKVQGQDAAEELKRQIDDSRFTE